MSHAIEPKIESSTFFTHSLYVFFFSHSGSNVLPASVEEFESQPPQKYAVKTSAIEAMYFEHVIFSIYKKDLPCGAGPFHAC